MFQRFLSKNNEVLTHLKQTIFEIHKMCLFLKFNHDSKISSFLYLRSLKKLRVGHLYRFYHIFQWRYHGPNTVVSLWYL